MFHPLLICWPERAGLPIFQRLSILLMLVMLAVPASADNLLTVYRLAIENDPEFRIAEADRLAGIQAKSSALAGVLPKVDLRYKNSESESANDGQEPIDTWRNSATLAISMPLVNVPAWHNVAAGKLQALAAEASYLEKRQEFILKVAQHYMDVLRAQDALASARAFKVTSLQQVELVQLRYAAGLDTLNDLEEARYGMSSAEAVYLQARSDLEVARISLSSITDHSAKDLYTLHADFQEWPPDMDSKQLITLVLRKNIYLRALRLQRDASQAVARAAIAQHMPKLDLNFNHIESETNLYESAPPEFSSFLPSRASDSVIELSFSLPLYAGGGTSAQRRRTQAQHESLKQQVHLAERNIRREMLSLHARITHSVATIKAQRQALKFAVSNQDATRIRYQAGTRTTLDLSRASRLTHDARLQYQSSRYDHILLRLQLERAIGDLDLNDLQIINNWLVAPPPLIVLPPSS